MPKIVEAASNGVSSRLFSDSGSSEDDQSFLTCHGDSSDDQETGTIFHDQQGDDDTAYDAIFNDRGGSSSLPYHHSLPGTPHSSNNNNNNNDNTNKNNDMNNNNNNQKGVKNNKTMQTVAGVAGNILEWYDFAVFGYFSDVLGEVFFPPNQEGHKAMIESFAVFGLAFLCRPIGGVMMGYIGDVHGRKKALEISIFLMAFPTFAMGCLPSYEKVGNWAIVLLTLVRMLQGFSVGGQLVSSLVYTCENNPRGQWGLYGSFVMAAANFGTLLGGLISYFLRATLNDEQLRSWGWRLPFLSGILVSLCGFYLRFYSDDDAIEHHHGGAGAGAAKGQNPIKAAFSEGNRRSLLASSLVPMLWSAGFYITFVWMATYMSVLVEPPVPGAFGVNSAALFISVCLFFPLAGILSDIFGRYKIMLLGGVAMGVLSPLMVIVISSGNSTAAFFAQSAMGIALSLWGAPMCAWLVESFPASIRLTSVAVGYNIAQAIVGGSAPALATYLVDTYGLHAPGYMISVIASFSVLGLCIGPDPIVDGEVDGAAVPESFITYGDDDDNDELSFEDVCETELI